jgi:signal transduction histidine kinase
VAGFTVDTKLFRELGELLVGRDSTALIELIKNSYDADATHVAISGRNLANADDGEIVISDNGIGMDQAEFERGFLTIAGRTKTSDQRRSSWFKRRYTGEKGVGRLAAHKLARSLRVTSRRWNGRPRDKLAGFIASTGVQASIDWDAIEELETLAQVERSGAVNVKKLASNEVARASAGTRLVLRPLRLPWTDKGLGQFFEEVVTLTPPSILSEPLPANFIKMTPLLTNVCVRDSIDQGGFTLEFLDDLTLRQPDLPAELQSVSWLIEIDCNAKTRKIAILVAPTRRTLEEFSTAEPFLAERPFPAGEPNVNFQARIFQRDGHAWPRAYSGVRVYHEGFRVLPYGDARDDWLELDADYRSRAKGQLGRLAKYSYWDLPPGDEKEGLVIQGNRQFFGAIFLTREGAPDLRILVNREGFLPGRQWDFISEMVRLGIDLQVRERYGATSIVKDARRAEKQRQRRASDRATVYQTPTAFLLQELQTDALSAVREARKAVSKAETRRAMTQLSNVEKLVGEAAALVGESVSEATIYRILAAMGLEQAAFIHEVNALAVLTQGLAKALDQLVKATSDVRIQRRLKAIAVDARSIHDRLRRNAVYLADMTGIEGRRRRSRQPLLERLEKAAEHYADSARTRGVTLANNLSSEIQTPPMFPAEVTAIFSNLLSNAIKFAGPDGKILVSARNEGDALVIRMENTGTAVDLKTAARWFEPFRSTTAEVDETLGQGMGLGLTITRSMVEEYGGTVEFVPPSNGFATAIEISLPVK